MKISILFQVQTPEFALQLREYGTYGRFSTLSLTTEEKTPNA